MFNWPDFITHLSQHIVLSLCAVLLASMIGIPIGILIHYVKKIRQPVLSITSLFQTIPSLAILALLIPLCGIGFTPTIITLVVYALLPLIRNTFIGLQSIDPALSNTANVLGFTPQQRLLKIELPLAFPMIIGGLRIATAMTVGITTIAAFIGAGGLGDYITQGLALNDMSLILLGAIPTAMLAICLDFIISQIESYTLLRRKITRSLSIKIGISAILICLFGGATATQAWETHHHKQKTIIVASKNFTEQFILGNLIAKWITSHTHLHVIRKLNLGTSTIAHNALLKGDIDLYPEYTGTAYLTLLHHHKILDPKKTFDIVRREYQQRFHLTWLAPLGFSNSETLAVSADFSKSHHIKTLSDLQTISNQLTIALTPEALKRLDGLPQLQRVYHLHFKKIIQMQADLMYDAIATGQVDAIECFTTDGRIAKYHLIPLKDNLNAYPPYQASIVIRQQTLRAYPQLRHVLNALSGKISTASMRHYNQKVDVDHVSPTVAASQLISMRLARNLTPRADKPTTVSPT